MLDNKQINYKATFNYSRIVPLKVIKKALVKTKQIECRLVSLRLVRLQVSRIFQILLRLI